MHSNRVAVIPARAGSTRFAEKPLATIAGRPMVQWVWEAARQSRLLNRTLVATDDERIAQAVRGFGGEAIMTPASLPSGTDRVFYALQGVDASLVVNLQGDEPLIEAGALDALVEGLESQPEGGMATLAIPKVDLDEWSSPHTVKIRFEPGGRVTGFSRQGSEAERAGFHKHLGVYAFRPWALEKFCSLPPSEREQAERLEQWRALENGIPIHAVIWHGDTVAVDRPEDIAKVEAALKQKRERSEV